MKKSFFHSIYFPLMIAFLSSCGSEETTRPAKVDILDAVFASGHIVLENEYLVTANAEGYLVKRQVAEGDSVRQGMPLFQLSNEVVNEQLSNARVNYEDSRQRLNPNSPQQAQLRLQIEQAQAQLALDERNLERYARLIESGAVSRVDYDQINNQYKNSKLQVEVLQNSLCDLIEQQRLSTENARSQLNIQRENADDFFLSSTLSGIVLETYKEQGELVRKGEAIAKIGGGKPLAKLYIAEEDINRIKVGQEVLVALNTDPEHPIEAKLVKIYPAFDEAEQSFICEAQFVGTKTLFANTQLQANIVIDRKLQTLSIPRDYLLEGDSVMTQDGKLIPIEVGIRSGEWVEVLSGLDASEAIKKQKQL